jgi:hypothetical protein
MLFFLLGVGTAASADETTAEKKFGSLLDSKFNIALGGFFPRVDSTFSLNAPNGSSGGDISIEDDLGLDKSTASAWIAFAWRFQPRHQLQFEWFQLNRDGDSTAQRNLPPIGDTTIGIGAGLSSKIDMNLGRITYGYSFYRSKDWELAFLAGLHIATFKATVTASGNVTVNGVPLVSGSRTESSSRQIPDFPEMVSQPVGNGFRSKDRRLRRLPGRSRRSCGLSSE